MSEPNRINCAICGRACKFVERPGFVTGWWCEPCDAFTETDVEVED
jgi:hypothetical protein